MPASRRESRRVWWLVVSGAFAAVMLVDVGGAMISKTVRVDYAYFAILSVAIYVVIGLTGARRMSLIAVTCAAFAVAAADATLGAYAASKVGVFQMSFTTLREVAVAIIAAKMVIALCTIVSVTSGVITLKLADTQKGTGRRK